MKRYIKHIIPAATLLLAMGTTTSCVNDLDVTPIDPNLVILDESSVDYLFNKCYANLALAGNSGADGDCDIDGLDGGTTGLIRQMWNSNELTTDEAICAWGDPGIANFHFNDYDGGHPMLRGYYYRLYNGITLCNHYLDVASDHNATMTAEVRFLRALQYYLAMDAYGNIPFLTTVSSEKAKQASRKEVYDFIESELLEIEPQLADAKAKNSSDSSYGRADKAAVWMLLMRLYLNAEVYTGTAQWAKAAEYAKKVMDSSYKLNTTGAGKWSAYQMLFMGDNGESSAAQECIFPVLCDGEKTTSYGTFFFIQASTFNAEMHANPDDALATNGSSDGTWAGNRARADLVAKFFPNNDAPNVESYNMTTAAGDDRAIFWGVDHIVDATDPGTFSNGFGVCKFVNFKSDGSPAHNSKFPDGDFFFFRAAEAYLTYAEATARANGGSTTPEGTAAINALRQRAHAATRAGYSLNEILDEWSREFYFEGRRRVDLIRYGYFGGNNNYTWQWKGGALAGRQFSADRNIFAIPTTDLTANENLKQNPGY
ncbi:MAG: RagB/SusD family nutrient uptake outer membrane protein [Prevotella sp.]|nr:RagB/SusD family nutrient uptake outer membrane protein [Prevotella sp.]